MKIVIGLLVVCLMTTVSFGYFMDEFDGPTLNSWWTEDNSPQNPAGSEFFFQGGMLKSSTNCQEAYHHLEAAISTTGNFEVETNIRVNIGMGVGTGKLAVYWDATHFVDLESGRGSYVSREYYNGSTFSSLDSTVNNASGWNFYTLKMEFTATKVKFYVSANLNSIPVYQPSLDLVRQSWMTGDALYILGKGSGDPKYGTNSDFNNDAATIYGADGLFIVYASYTPEPATMGLLGLGSLLCLRRRKLQ